MGQKGKTADREFRELYDLFLRFNRRLLTILDLLKPPLATSPSHLLSELYVSRESIARDLTNRLMLPKGTVSRTMASLERAGYLRSRPSKSDRRVKDLELTVLGRRIVETDLDARNHEMVICMAPLTGQKRKRLLNFLTTIADQLNAPIYSGRPQDDPLLNVIRRLTRGMGFYGDNCMGTGLRSEVCQVLHLAYGEPDGLSVQEASHRTVVEMSDFSRLLKQLEEAELISRATLKEDRRRVIIRLAPSGRRRAERNIALGTKLFKDSLKTLSKREITEFIELLDSLVYHPIPESLAPASVKWSFAELSDDEGYEAARRFLIDTLSRSSAPGGIPSILINPQNRIFALFDRTILKGVVEIGASSGQEQVHNLAVAADLERSRAGARLFTFAISKLHPTLSSLNEVKVPAQTYSYYLGNNSNEILNRGMITLKNVELRTLFSSLI